jgi:hypothetical protein
MVTLRCHRVRKPNLPRGLLNDQYPFAGKTLPTEERYMPQISGSATIHTNMPLSKAERAHRYRQGLRKLRGPTFLRRIRMTDKTVRGLIKRGYLVTPSISRSWILRQLATSPFFPLPLGLIRSLLLNEVESVHAQSIWCPPLASAASSAGPINHDVKVKRG